MPSIRRRADSDLLFFEFRFLGQRCREQTMLSDNAANRKKLEKVLSKIEAEIAAGTFVYGNYFPNSKALKRLERAATQAAVATIMTPVAAAVDSVIREAAPETPLFAAFANQWVDEHSIEWRRSHIRSLHEV